MKTRKLWTVMFLGLSIYSCGSQPVGVPNLSTEVNSAEAQLTKIEPQLKQQGFVKLSDKAFVQDKLDGGLEFYTEAPEGDEVLLDYLSTEIITAESKLTSAKVNQQSVTINDMSIRIALLKETKASFTKFVNSDVKEVSQSGGMRPQQEFCYITYATAYATGVKSPASNAYAYAKADISDATGSCYAARMQVDAGYPRLSNVASWTNFGAYCSGNNCFNISDQQYGYPSNGVCYAGAYLTTRTNAYSPELRKGASFNC